MTITATGFLSNTDIDVGAASTGHLGLTGPAKREIERLTESLFFGERGLRHKSVLMVEIGSGKSSSLWLAAGVASALGNSLGQTVHVLSLTSEACDAIGATERTGLGGTADSCIVERIADAATKEGSASVLRDRLSELQAKSRTVIVHLSQFGEQAYLLARMSSVEGVVLLIRAAQARRAAIEAIERQLSTTRTPILGSVLLDRVHPIPEKLYRLL